MKFWLSNQLNRHQFLWITLLVFGVIYALISLVNHYNFRTYALDLGAYTNALYDYVHFQFNDSTVFKNEPKNLLADHFDVYLILFAPLALIFKSYTLLIVQIFFILLGGVGVYRYFNLKQNNRQIAKSATLYFYLFFGVFSAVSNDYHSNVIAATIVPWFFHYLRKREVKVVALLFVAILIAKENTSLWMAFICLGLLFEYRKDGFLRNFMILGILLSISYFILVTSYVMPSLSGSSTYPHFHYSEIGSTPSAALIYLLSHPLESLKMLFVNHNHQLSGVGIKAELHLFILLSGLPFLIKKPQYLVMLIPIYFQKLFHDNYMMWGIGGQYSIEYAPILAIGTFSVVETIQHLKWRKWAVAILCLAAAGCTLRFMDNTVMYTNKPKVRIYQKSHYTRKYDVKKVHRAISNIPSDAIVSAQTHILPHLSFRNVIYQFPIIKNSDFIIYSNIEDPYPLEENRFTAITDSLEHSEEWRVTYKEEALTILEKNK